MRERWLGVFVGLTSVVVTYGLARLEAGWAIAAFTLAGCGWLVGGCVRRLACQAQRDELTGLANRRTFEQTLAREWERAVRYDRPLSLLFIDVDDFGQINKLYGHLMGDEALKAVTRLIRHNTRKIDLVGRWGGEEFVVLLPETGIESAFMLAERIRCAIAQHVIRDRDCAIQLTVSTGVSGMPGTVPTARDLVRQAIAGEAAAKTSKNTVRCVS